jgi:hypothetical protein
MPMQDEQNIDQAIWNFQVAFSIGEEVNFGTWIRN